MIQLGDAVARGSSNISLNKVKNDEGEYSLYSAKGFYKNISFFHQEEEYLAIIKDGAGVGRISIHPPKSSCVGTMQYLIPKEGFNIGFIRYCLLSIDFTKYSQGSTIPHIYFKDYKSELIPNLSVEEQLRLVSKLDQAFEAIDQAIANTEKNTENIEVLRNSYIKDLWGNLFRINPIVTIGESCEFKNGGAHEKLVIDEGYTLVNSKFISSNGTKAKCVSEAITPLYINDIAFVMSDVPNGKALGKAFLVDKDGKYTLNQRIGRIKSTDFLPKFLFYQVNRNPHFLSFNNGENQTNLRKGQILSCPLVRPDFDIQAKVVKQIDDFESKISSLLNKTEQKLKALNELKMSILEKAFNGELV